MRMLALASMIVSLVLVGCSKKAEPAPAPAAPVAAPAVAPGSAATPAATPAPAAAAPSSRVPTPAAAPAATAAPAAPPTDAERNLWGKVDSETIEGGIMTRKVQSPWGVITVTGPLEEPGVTVVRYWTDWLRADFPSAFAYATGRMKKGLALLDNPDGHKDYAQAIPQRYADNPVMAFHVDNVTATASGAATISSTLTHRDGKTEGRKSYLVLEDGKWLIEFIGRK
jgi:hypothetical protein